MRVALDVDGTVIGPQGQPIEGAVDRAWQLVEANALVGYVTYRSESIEEQTRQLLVDAGLPDEPVHGCPPTGVVDAAGAKAKLLEAVEATHYVGDAPFDREAARLPDILGVSSRRPQTFEGKERDRRRTRRVRRGIRDEACNGGKRETGGIGRLRAASLGEAPA